MFISAPIYDTRCFSLAFFWFQDTVGNLVSEEYTSVSASALLKVYTNRHVVILKCSKRVVLLWKGLDSFVVWLCWPHVVCRAVIGWFTTNTMHKQIRTLFSFKIPGLSNENEETNPGRSQIQLPDSQFCHVCLKRSKSALDENLTVSCVDLSSVIYSNLFKKSFY